MFKFSDGKYFVFCSSDKKNGNLAEGAAVVEYLVRDDDYSEYIIFGVGDHFLCPDLVIHGNYSPASASGFNPGILIVPDTNILFFGAGDLVQVWDLSNREKQFDYTVDCGFWHWNHHKDLVLMSGELEFAVWGVDGKRLWSCFVEPPWSYTVDGDIVLLDVMGGVTKKKLYSGTNS
ncbi:hypothetical protein [Hydrogenophaga sp. 5NK40-0174]|uniref:hypothetical protein n=1 Tax=Hydrogenophaga sp. 5NK40-0174 TaxID=3127649 RepID=UPI003104D24B